MRIKLVIGTSAVLVAGVPSARATLLYDGTLGTAPEAQPWLFYSPGLSGSPTHTTTGADTTLDTTSANTIQAGYSNYVPTSFSTAVLKNSAFPTLNSAVGFDLNFNLKLDAENHTAPNNRGGLDVILLDQNHTGVELDFWNTQIFSLDGNFNPAESNASFNASTGFYNYDLHIANGNYTLSANGSPILNGPTRDYSGTTSFPYNLPNYFFIGDDNVISGAKSEITSIAVVPEPAGMALGIAALSATAARRRRRA